MSVVRPSQLLVPTILLLFSACGESAAAGLSLDPPAGLKKAVLTPPPADNPLTIDKAELGKVLFFDPRLSASGKMSCSTCHLPEKAFTDGKDFSPKDDGSVNTRNSPSMYNVGYWTKWYWDGRTATLEANATAAWTAQMKGKPDDVAKTLAAIPAYKEMFQKAFGAEPSAKNIPMALASFLRVLQSGNSPFDQFLAGNQDALTNEAKMGYELFTGAAGCIACHVVQGEALFTDRLFHNVGIGIDDPHKDLGAYGVKDKVPEFADEKFMSAFKTPSLRNVALTAPYFTDASRKTLRDAVKFMAGGGKDNPNKDKGLLDRKLKDGDIDNLVAFLQSLTDNPKFEAPKIPQ
jgi:cytochrome c peroxidase